MSSGLDNGLLRGVHWAGQCERVSSGLDNWTVEEVSTGLDSVSGFSSGLDNWSVEGVSTGVDSVSGCPMDWTMDC